MKRKNKIKKKAKQVIIKFNESVEVIKAKNKRA